MNARFSPYAATFGGATRLASLELGESMLEGNARAQGRSAGYR